MNFEYMPELQAKWGYFVCLAFMGAIASGSVYYFWRQGWFRPLDAPHNER
jgi:magnesium transporter